MNRNEGNELTIQFTVILQQTTGSMLLLSVAVDVVSWLPNLQFQLILIFTSVADQGDHCRVHCCYLVRYLLLQSRCLLCTLHKYLRLQLCYPLRRTTAAFTTEIVPLQCLVFTDAAVMYSSHCGFLQNVRTCELAQYSHEEYKRHSIVIRRTCPRFFCILLTVHLDITSGR